MYTVKQLAELAGITVRTLHHYDEIGLLPPTRIAANGYRQYDDAAVLRLQQILLYREIGLELLQIKDALDDPAFDMVEALRSHRSVLEQRVRRLHTLIHTVDSTIEHLEGKTIMSNKKKLFQGISQEQEAEWNREARLTYDPGIMKESARLWGSYSEAQKQAIFDEGNANAQALMEAMQAGLPATDETVQNLIARWHQHLHYFYTPTLEILRGLGELYVTDPRFKANIDNGSPGFAEYMQAGINQYVDDLEYAEIERMLAVDEAERGRL
jgi:MerR family transcriptional regulator, thiopeptide resistance regulator